MAAWDRTYRVLDDGERIEGVWRHAFIHNGGTYFLIDLKIYSDGLIDCWGLVDLDGFREKVRAGWVTTSLPEGAAVSVHHLARWTANESHCIGTEEFVAEVEDTIAELQGRPTRTDRFDDALTTFATDTSETNRLALRSAYLAVPDHLRPYLLGDQNMADWPVQVVVGSIGDPVRSRVPPFDVQPISGDDRRIALDYLARREHRWVQPRTIDDDGDPDGTPVGARHPTVGAGGIASARERGWLSMDGDGFLSNDTPVTVVLDGVEYPSVTHAYWSLAASDVRIAEEIRTAPSASDAVALGKSSVRRPDWPVVRLAMMTRLVRAKFDQHPDLAAKLLATGDARIVSPFGFSGQMWNPGSEGRNWVGRILELVRSELQLRSFAG